MVFQCFWPPWRFQESLLGASWVLLGASRSFLDASGGILVGSWASQGLSWGRLGASWSRLGPRKMRSRNHCSTTAVLKGLVEPLRAAREQNVGARFSHGARGDVRRGVGVGPIKLQNPARQPRGILTRPNGPKARWRIYMSWPAHTHAQPKWIRLQMFLLLAVRWASRCHLR